MLMSLSITALMPRLLIKIPTRSRPEQFFKYLDIYYQQLSRRIPVTFLISCDDDDISMNNKAVKEKLAQYSDLFFYFAPRTTKVDAYNRDLDKHPDWDILLAASDDAKPEIKGYDLILASLMIMHFPDYDGVINFFDGFQKENLNTFPVIGKKYFNRFGYIYYPKYKGFYCDTEFTAISKKLGKEFYYPFLVLKHYNPWWKNGPDDALYHENGKSAHDDERLYNDRTKKNFDITNNKTEI